MVIFVINIFFYIYMLLIIEWNYFINIIFEDFCCILFNGRSYIIIKFYVNKVLKCWILVFIWY